MILARFLCDSCTIMRLASYQTRNRPARPLTGNLRNRKLLHLCFAPHLLQDDMIFAPYLLQKFVDFAPHLLQDFVNFGRYLLQKCAFFAPNLLQNRHFNVFFGKKFARSKNKCYLCSRNQK